MPTSLSTKKRRLSNIFSKTSTVPCACVAVTTAIEVRSAGNAGQGPSSIFGIWPPRSSWISSRCPGGTRTRRLPHLDVDAEPRERGQDREQVPGLDVLDRDVAARRGREADEAADLDVLGSDAPVAAVQLGDAVDAEDVRLDPLDLGAERDEEAAEVLDMRLAGGVADHRLALGEHGRHDDVLGRHHARLVEEDRLAAQPRRAHLEAAVDLDLDAELGEAVDVRVEPAPPDHVAAGRRHGRAAEAREQRAGEQERGADAAAQLLVELGLVHAGRVDPDLVLARATRRRRRRRSAARPSSGRRGSAARSSAARARSRAPWRRGSAARRSCSRPRGRCR